MMVAEKNVDEPNHLRENNLYQKDKRLHFTKRAKHRRELCVGVAQLTATEKILNYQSQMDHFIP